MLDVNTYYRARFEAGEAGRGALATNEHWWGFRKIKHGLKRQCDDVREINMDRNADMRMITATERDHALKFTALLKFDPSNSGFLLQGRNRINEMYYVAAFAGPGGEILNLSHRDEVDELTKVSTVILDEGKIFLFAQPLIDGKFNQDFFSGQLEYFLKDLRRTGVFLYA